MTSQTMTKTILDPLLTIQISKSDLSTSTTEASYTSVTSLCFLNPSSTSELSQPIRKHIINEASLFDEVEYNKRTTSNNYDSSDSEDNDRIINDNNDTSNIEDYEQISNKGYDSSDSDTNEVFRCNQLADGQDQDIFESSSLNNFDFSSNLQCHVLATADLNGETHLWDLSKSKAIGKFLQINRGPGLLLRRVDSGNGLSQIIYQTRDQYGTVSLHDVYGKTFGVFETQSHSFCAATPCVGDMNLVALPDCDEKQAVVRDWRISPSTNEFIRLRAADSSKSGSSENGMLTSLGLAESSSNSLVLACGMESGNLFFHDLRMTNRALNLSEADNSLNTPCSCKLSNGPVLSLDIGTSLSQSSFVVVAGMAGDTAELIEQDPKDRGTVAVVKAFYRDTKELPIKNSTKSITPKESWFEARVRAKFATCRMPTNSSLLTPTGKPGVSICRLHPAGRIFAVGGWDNRVRIFDRSVNKLSSTSEALKAILRGHKSSVNAIDWCPGSICPGLIATAGATDDTIFIWYLI